MSINEIYKHFEKLIYSSANNEQEEEKMLEKLEDIDEKLRELESDIEECEQQCEEYYESYEQMNSEWLDANAIQAWEYGG